jgi:hypothetical protein
LTFSPIYIIFISKEDLAMFTAEMEVEPVVDDLDGVPEEDDSAVYEYPPELIKHWSDEIKKMKSMVARGELQPTTVEDLAAELGVTLD